ncbi:hypothetical protein U3516DRAFT_735014 [Neocallimastix sp. 'constans']
MVHFFIAPKFSYQIFITRTYAKELDKAYLKHQKQHFLIQILNTGFAIHKANEISVLIERYKNIEAKLIDAKCD